MSVSSYTNVDRVRDSFPAIGSASNITSATIFEYVQAANDTIDLALATRYTLPMSSFSPLLGTLATRIALFDLITIRAMAQMPADMAKNNPFYDRLKEARKTLEQLAEGKLTLLNSSGQVIAERTDIVGAWSNTMGYLPTMHEGNYTDMVEDADKLADIVSDRELN